MKLKAISEEWKREGRHLAVSVDGDFYFPGYDNNGNVIGYWNEDGDLVAEIISHMEQSL